MEDIKVEMCVLSLSYIVPFVCKLLDHVCLKAEKSSEWGDKATPFPHVYITGEVISFQLCQEVCSFDVQTDKKLADKLGQLRVTGLVSSIMFIPARRHPGCYEIFSKRKIQYSENNNQDFLVHSTSSSSVFLSDRVCEIVGIVYTVALS